MFKTIDVFFRAATAFLKVWPIVQQRKLFKDIEGYEDQIFQLGLSGADPADKLQIDALDKRRQRALEQIRFISAATHHFD